MNFFKAALVLIYISICGFGLVKLFLKDKIPFSLFGLVPLSFGAGLGVLAILCNLIILLGLRLSFASVYAPLSILFVYALFQMKLPADLRQKLSPAAMLKALGKLTWKEWIFIFVIVFGAFSVFLISVAFPLHFWDSRAIWGAKAKMLFYSRTVFSSDFMDVDRIHAHFRYPLLFPLSQAFLYLALGQADDWAVMLLIGLFFPFMISFLYDLARSYLQDREKALAAAALVSVLPVYFISDGPANSGYADTPLAMLYCLSFGMTLLWKKLKDTRLLLLSAFLSGILFLTKNEGINLIALNLFLVILPDNLSFNKEKVFDLLKKLAFYLAIIALIAAPWLILVNKIPNEVDVNDILQVNIKNLDFSKLPMATSFSLRAFLGIQKNMMDNGYFLWGGLWLVFALTAFAAASFRSLGGIQLSLVVLAFFIGNTLLYALIPGASEEFMVSNFFRIYLAISPVVALQVASTLKFIENIYKPPTTPLKVKEKKRRKD